MLKTIAASLLTIMAGGLVTTLFNFATDIATLQAESKSQIVREEKIEKTLYRIEDRQIEMMQIIYKSEKKNAK